MSTEPRPCAERGLLLHGLADGELDAFNALMVEEHLQGCRECAAAYREILHQKKLLKGRDLRLQAPASLRDSIMSAIAAEERAMAGEAASNAIDERRQIPRRAYIASAMTAFSAMALAASITLFVSSQSSMTGLDRQLVAGHVRSLLVSHLTDVASSDRHTVKPWFLGKADFAPPVVDMAEKDYPMIGGRLDYIDSRVVAAVVYRRQRHVINLFIWPAGKMKASDETIDGYHVVSWTQGGFTYAAVSDLNVKELQEFQSELSKALPSP